MYPPKRVFMLGTASVTATVNVLYPVEHPDKSVALGAKRFELFNPRDLIYSQAQLTAVDGLPI